MVAYLDFNTPYENFHYNFVDHPYDTVFILEPREAIFTKDNERYEFSRKYVLITFKTHIQNTRLSTIVVPKCSVAERVTFIEQHLSFKMQALPITVLERYWNHRFQTFTGRHY